MRQSNSSRSALQLPVSIGSVGAITLLCICLQQYVVAARAHKRAQQREQRRRRRWKTLKQAVAMINASHAGTDLADQAKSQREQAWYLAKLGPRFLLASYRKAARTDTANDHRFRDADFPPELQSIVCESELQRDRSLPDRSSSDLSNCNSSTSLVSAQSLLERLSAVEWVRCIELFPDGFSVCGSIHPSDIQQGELEDCYFLSVLSVLAEQPDVVRSLFVSCEPNEECVYALRFCVKGIWRTTIVDDYIPCWPGVHNPVFSKVRAVYCSFCIVFLFSSLLNAHRFSHRVVPQSNSHSLWVMLLEKAWAKLHGSYYSIMTGLPGEALADLTGAPVEFIPVRNISLFTRIMEATCDDPHARGKGWFVCGVIPFYDQVGNEMIYVRSVGLLEGHAYSILDARQLAGDCVVKVRQPWGHTMEWTGEWSDSSERWNDVSPAVKEEIGFKKRDDGTFWMSIEDLQKYFVGVEICKYVPHWVSSGTLVQLPPGLSASVRMQFSVAPQLCVKVHQRAREDARSEYAAEELSGIRLMVVRGNDKTLAAYHPMTVQRDLCTAFFSLPAGTHWVVVSHGANRPLELGVSVNSSVETKLSSGGVKASELREIAMAKRAKRAGHSETYATNFPTLRGSDQLYRLHYRERDMFVWHFVNESRRLALHERMAFELSNVRVADMTGDEILLWLEPGEEKTVILEQCDGKKPLHWSLECYPDIEHVSIQKQLRFALPFICSRQSTNA